MDGVLDEYYLNRRNLEGGILYPEMSQFLTSLPGYLKFVLLFGFLTLEGAQQAVAAYMVALVQCLHPWDTHKYDTSDQETWAMTIICVVLGRSFHHVNDILPGRFGDTDLLVNDVAAVVLLVLVYFGVSTLVEASFGDGLKAEEEQNEAKLAVSQFSGNESGILATANTVISTFLLSFVAEWGDKYLYKNIALVVASSPLGVVGGALASHGVATSLAVLGGSLLGTFSSEKVVAYIGVTLFAVFASVTLVETVT
ncbi:LOW QUALITY PROTEIN: protein PAM71, chloroplastic-like [Rhododendron vialii]|uniref:LOW QUALITY PROTEIN: protein PAM71, chloroplastic-like n=1 Tax=Rhododendron vialii TaxID=182163 RepID=UPI00265E2A11|nr:LOW QUALITY PROTEIN: protein PAM71, chloroplastic-like [Rhododendron vialii]